MKSFNHALIMAAGRGIRMMPLTAKKPKAMAVLNGNSLKGHNIYKLSNKIKNIHITVGYKNSETSPPRTAISLTIDPDIN